MTAAGARSDSGSSVQKARDELRGFRWRLRFELAVGDLRRVVVSAPAIAEESLASKDLLSAGAVANDGKYTLDEHRERLRAGERPALDPETPVLVLGLRNSLVNSRAVLALGGRSWGADGEDPRRSARPYFGLARRGDLWAMERALGPRGGHDGELFVAGVPVLWDGGFDERNLWDALLTETADHSHLFRIHRGNHPQATGASRAAWRRLHEVFQEHLYADFESASRTMREAVAALPEPFRQRCDTYLHGVLGVDGDGRLIYLVAHGRLEEIGRLAAERGCRRAICVENSGSVMPTLLPGGIRGPAVPLLRAPNFRPKGRVLLFLGLADGAFEVLA